MVAALLVVLLAVAPASAQLGAWQRLHDRMDSGDTAADVLPTPRRPLASAAPLTVRPLGDGRARVDDPSRPLGGGTLRVESDGRGTLTPDFSR